MAKIAAVILAVLTLVVTPAAADHPAGTLPKGGVNTHLLYKNTPYADLSRTASGVKVLEAKMVRDTLPPGQGLFGTPTNLDRFREINRVSGAKFVMLSARADWNVTQVLDTMAPLVAEGRVAAIEGPNEWDNVAGRTDSLWAEKLRAHQRDLYNQVKARWPSMPVIAPSLSYKTGAYVGPLPADICNLHYYATSAGISVSDLDERIYHARQVCGQTAPLWVTEANGIMGDGYPGETAQTQANAFTNLVNVLSSKGAHRIFLYELINGSRENDPPTSRENNFGAYLVRTDGRLETKPVFFPARDANRRG